MPNWVIFYFLWDDPLFTDQVGDPKDYVDDPDFIELRREIRLSLLDLLYTKISRLEKQLEQLERWKKLSYLETWTWMQLLPHVPPEIRRRVHVERTVNRMDPDFSFEREVERKAAA